jgi:hypothetical protein
MIAMKIVSNVQMLMQAIGAYKKRSEILQEVGDRDKNKTSVELEQENINMINSQPHLEK